MLFDMPINYASPTPPVRPSTDEIIRAAERLIASTKNSGVPSWVTSAANNLEAIIDLWRRGKEGA
jgi:hypothetical protein